MGAELKTSLARCWKILRSDGQSFCFTDHNEDIMFDNDTYSSVSPLNMSSLEKNIGLDTDNVEISGTFHHESIVETDIENGLFDQAKIVVFEFDWVLKTKNRVLFQGLFSSYSYGDDRFSVEAQSAFGKLGHVFGRGFHLTCDADLGDENCGIDINLPSYKFTPNIIKFLENGIEISSIVGIAEGRFQNGTAELIANERVISKLSIKSDVLTEETRQITFWNNLNSNQTAADNINLYIGCDKSIDCCCQKFGNAINFRGFPNIPNDDWINVQQDN